MHGKTSKIISKKLGILKNLPKSFEATRYHSLIIDKKSLSKHLEITAESKDGLIMGVQHEEFNIHGVQFHPESIASENGHRLLANFMALAGFDGAPLQPIQALEAQLRKTGT